MSSTRNEPSSGGPEFRGEELNVMQDEAGGTATFFDEDNCDAWLRVPIWLLVDTGGAQ